MKTFKHLNNVEKAKLLFGLFPDEVPAYIETMQGMSLAIEENETEYRAKWDNAFFDFDFWLRLVQHGHDIIKQYGKKLYHNQRLFTDQLFDGYQALYSIHCLRGYTTKRRLENMDFYKAFDLFFSI
ncbi:hypothetical protein FMM05_00185 [Flavobacterium zepuense]|uniref:Uncharacterized protein n=1 Tax=Flavobacterium zepuense TaxID=2593302 RepID=A0A552V9G1_9FLAO|nr:hypothetical protein [Flavobacterium zepuense]TRW27104.1 hypothetical protein FMM05_00185 [Flavobacterium zepuense]